MKNDPSFALVVHACDNYALLFDAFDHFFTQCGGKNIGCQRYFLTENTAVHFDGFVNLKTGNGAWSDRLAHGLRQIPEKYVIYFQEDMWLDKPISPIFFNKLFDFILENDPPLVKLHPSKEYFTVDVGNSDNSGKGFDSTENLEFKIKNLDSADGERVFIEGFQLTKLDNRRSGYLMSHQISVWRKDFLLAQLPPNEHPWRNERRATKRLRRLNPPIFQLDYFGENDSPPNNQNLPTATPSHYFSVSANGTFDKTAEPFIAQLEKLPPLSIYAEKLRFHYENQLTHSGAPRPRREGAFKKFRIWLRRQFSRQ